MIVKIKRYDFHPEWIDLGDGKFNVFEAYRAGVNSFVYIDDGYEDRIKIPVIEMPVQSIPATAEMTIGRDLMRKFGLVERRQPGKNRPEDNEE